MGESALEKEHERIRQLHQRQQESLRNLQALESKLNGVNLDGDKTRRESSPPSQVPNNEPSTTSSSSALQSAMKRDGQLNAKYNEVFASTENLKAYDSDDATSDEEGEHLTVDELSQCTGLVQELLEKISMLQQTLKATQSTFRCPKSRVHKLYRRFCWKFESEMVSAGGTNPSSLLDIPIRNSVPLSHSSSQQRTAIHLTNIPSVRVTGSADSEGLAPPQSDFASPGVDHAPSEGPQAPPLKISTNHSNPWLSSHSMGNCLPPDASPIHAPLSIMHERTPSVNSNSNIPSPVSISGPRSPLLSPVGDRRPSIATALGNIRHQSEDASSQDGDDAMSPRRNNTYKRSEEPPRDWQGRMICKHTECASITFDRKCEWRCVHVPLRTLSASNLLYSKHMDKHERPYKCTIQGCEKLQGFTYSGGLLRHEREVHHMHGGKKKSLFCPFADCKRSSGSGFTRKENLAEHIRRVHRRTTQSSDLSNLVIPRPDIEEDIIPKVHALSESPNQRVGDVREEDGAGLRQKRKSTWDADDSDRRGQFKRSRGEYEGQDARLPSLGQHMANHDNSGSNTAMDSCESLSIPMDQSGNTPSGEVEGKATKGKDIVSVLLEKWTIPIS